MRLVVAGLAALLGSLAAAAAPESLRFGDVLQGTPVRHAFELRNDSGRPVRVEGVQASAPLKIERFPAMIGAGGSTPLRIELDTARLKGEYAGKVIVALSGGIEGTREYEVSGRVIPPLEVLPLPAIFISTPRGKEKSASVEVVNHADRPVELSIGAQPPVGTARLEALEPGRRFRVTLTVPADAPPGRASHRLELRTSLPAKPVLPIGVNTAVRERVHTFPEAVDLGELRLAELVAAPGRPNAHAQTLMVYQAEGRDFAVSATSDVAGLEVGVEHSASRDRAQVTLHLVREKARMGPIEGTLVLRTNDPEFPELRVPISGRVLPAARPGGK